MAALSDILILVVPLIIAVIVYLQICRTRSKPSVSTEHEESKQLSKLPIVTITANEILLDKDMKLLGDGTKPALEMLSKHACIFLFVMVDKQEEADALRQPLAKQFEGVIDPEHILYTQKELGRASMSRQLESVAHFDYDPEVVHQTSIFFNTVLIAPPNVESPHAKWKASSFKDFITSGNTEFFDSIHH
ncbi:hypothetical protein M9Y10_021090 [Tritrichomonas musculus]|uniref:Uncharacterized protein n=1 Tax=Tritrichomonas musculus TaxID=1915356 RepID=A0ABR2HE28_9EUKA